MFSRAAQKSIVTWSALAALCIGAFAGCDAASVPTKLGSDEASEVREASADGFERKDRPDVKTSNKDRPTEFAADRPGAIAFDGKRAMEYLEQICKIGTRISGTEGIKKEQELIEKHFEKLGAKVTYQKFSAKQNGQKAIDMANMIVSWNPDRERRVIICSHYDTRPIPHEEPDRRKWKEPFISANDGGSGVALLMELGNQMKEIDPKLSVDFVFFDGEEYVFEHDDKYFFGSEYFASEYFKNRAKSKIKYRSAILLDMVGGKKISFPIERNSAFLARSLVKEVWDIAGELKCEAFHADKLSDFEVQDDHLALNRVGIPAIDIIDFTYPHWHRLSDLPENCSGESMAQVARVLSAWLQRVR